ncbi:hypothetical protein BH24ACT4_BH24ACT4_20850 [soil metagenome]
MRVLALVVGGLVTLTIVGVSSLAAANVLVRTSETDSQTLEGQVARAEIRVDGSVDIEVGAAGRTRIDRRSTFGLSRPGVTETLVDGLLIVEVTCDGLPVICSNDVAVELPPSAEVSIDAEEITVTGVSRRIATDPEGGSVRLTDVSGPLDIRAGGGSVTGTGIESDEVRVSVGAGAVELDFRSPPSDVEATTGAGAVIVSLPPGEETYRVDATSGAGEKQVDVATDPASHRRVRVNAGAGYVEVRYGPS